MFKKILLILSTSILAVSCIGIVAANDYANFQCTTVTTNKNPDSGPYALGSKCFNLARPGEGYKEIALETRGTSPVVNYRSDYIEAICNQVILSNSGVVATGCISKQTPYKIITLKKG